VEDQDDREEDGVPADHRTDHLGEVRPSVSFGGRPSRDRTSPSDHDHRDEGDVRGDERGQDLSQHSV
jgi:hypothetical protein